MDSDELDDERRRELLLLTDAGRRVLAGEDAQAEARFAKEPGHLWVPLAPGPRGGKKWRSPSGFITRHKPKGAKDYEQVLADRPATPAAIKAIESVSPLDVFSSAGDKWRHLVALGTRVQSVTNGPATGLRERDPLGVFTQGPPPGLDTHSFGEDLIGAAARQQFVVGAEPSLRDLYETVAPKYGLNKHAFLRAVADRHASQVGDPVFHLRGSSLSGYQHEMAGDDPELMMISPVNGRLVHTVELAASHLPQELLALGARGDQSLPPPTRFRGSRRYSPNVAGPELAPTLPADASPPDSGPLSSAKEDIRYFIGRLQSGSRYVTSHTADTTVMAYCGLSRSEVDDLARWVGVPGEFATKRDALKAIARHLMTLKKAP